MKKVNELKGNQVEGILCINFLGQVLQELFGEIINDIKKPIFQHLKTNILLVMEP